MQKKLLAKILKSKKKKSLQALVDEFVQTQTNTAVEQLEEFLSDMVLYINKNYDSIEHDTLLTLIKGKLGDLNIAFDTKEVDDIYGKLALAYSPSTKIVFDKIDIKAIEQLRNGFYWVGKDYSAATQDKLKNTIESAFKGELTRADLTKKLKEDFQSVIDQDRNYFKLVSDNAISQSQNIARVNQALKYDVEHFQVKARMDDDTSDICRSMNGKIISAAHMKEQISNIVGASSIDEKKATAAWQTKPIYGKLPKNVGLAPYHGHCRTENIPVWLNEEEIDGKKVKFANKKKSDIITHIDKTGVQRRVDVRTFGHSRTSISRQTPKKDVISALNSIEHIAPHKEFRKRAVAKCSNGYFITFDGDYVYTIFKPTDKKGKSSLDAYFKKYAKQEQIEVIKWKNTQLISQTHGQSNILKILTKKLNWSQ